MCAPACRAGLSDYINAVWDCYPPDLRAQSITTQSADLYNCDGASQDSDGLAVVLPAFIWAFAFGDPHLTTLDGREYSFNGHGEYWLLKDAQSNAAVQARFEPCSGSGRATCTTAVAVKIGIRGEAVELKLASDSTLEVYHRDGGAGGGGNSCRWANDGECDDGSTGRPVYCAVGTDSNDCATGTAISAASTLVVTDVASHDFGTRHDHVRVSSDGAVEVETVHGVKVTAIATNGQITIGVAADNLLVGNLRGLYGNFNGDETDDFISADGSTTASTEEEIHAFGESWRVSQTESLFTYTSDHPYASFHDPQFLPTPTPVPTEEALAACGSAGLEGSFLTRCAIDETVTGRSYTAIYETAQSLVTSKREEECDQEPPAAHCSSTAAIIFGVTLAIVVAAAAGFTACKCSKARRQAGRGSMKATGDGTAGP